MQRYEYKVIRVCKNAKFDESEIDYKLNKFGKKGYKFITFDEQDGQYFIIMEKLTEKDAKGIKDIDQEVNVWPSNIPIGEKWMKKNGENLNEK